MRVAKPVVLVGLMAAGKSTVARLLAPKIGAEVVDNDAQLVAATGFDAKSLAAAQGPDVLHEWERKLLLEAINRPGRIVTAAASIADWPDAAQLLSHSYCVWLKAQPSVLLQRAARGEHRPDFANVTDVVQELAQKRGVVFRELADFVIDTEQMQPQEAADAIYRWLETAPAPDNS